jgi:decaprenylphospho-beta-D-erythro-pentofuranosid-2-ulose 2-reductase
MAARMMTVNVTWPVAALAEIRRRLVLQGSGRILVMSSAAAIRVRRVAYLYSGAKAGLDRLCVGLAQSLDGTGVTLQLLRPAVVRTKMTVGMEEPPFTTGPNEVADNVMRGLATNDLVVWSPPALRYIFFFLRHLPTPLWRKLADR